MVTLPDMLTPEQSPQTGLACDPPPHIPTENQSQSFKEGFERNRSLPNVLFEQTVCKMEVGGRGWKEVRPTEQE